MYMYIYICIYYGYIVLYIVILDITYIFFSTEYSSKLTPEKDFFFCTSHLDPVYPVDVLKGRQFYMAFRAEND